jgi:ferredoxin-thioredoxin reductase catalytic subunit
MNFIEISEAEIDTTYRTLKSDAEEGGYRLNPDSDFTKNLVRGLLKNERRYGYRACPCRLAAGKKGQDLDIICPCDYRDLDLEEFGACYCALYVSDDVATGKKRLAAPVPERRPSRTERSTARAVKTTPVTPGAGSLPLPVWRCRVCGYLCARDQPPGICPICKATKERFERFI